MKSLSIIFFLFLSLLGNAQYFYKDIIGTKETTETIKGYRTNKVSGVVLTSYEADDTKSDDFFVAQVFSPTDGILKTTTRSGASGASTLTSFTDAKGNVIKTIDSSEASISITTYTYNAEGLLQTVISSATDTANTFTETEEHQWQYSNGKPEKMLRIKDKKDTSFVLFTLDDKGNVSEERSTRKGIREEPVYYYYDSNNRLTDIVRFSNKARRLLPEYMFEYSPANQVIQKITVPANGSNYLIWRYQYDSRGLKIKEAIYDKQKQLTGKIEYQYQFHS